MSQPPTEFMEIKQVFSFGVDHNLKGARYERNSTSDTVTLILRYHGSLSPGDGVQKAEVQILMTQRELNLLLLAANGAMEELKAEEAPKSG